MTNEEFRRLAVLEMATFIWERPDLLMAAPVFSAEVCEPNFRGQLSLSVHMKMPGAEFSITSYLPDGLDSMGREQALGALGWVRKGMFESLHTAIDDAVAELEATHGIF